MEDNNLIQYMFFCKCIILFTGANLFMNCALTCQLTKKGATVVYISIRNRNPLLCKYLKQKTKVNIDPSYENRQNKIMMTNITMEISFPSIFMMNLCTFQTSK